MRIQTRIESVFVLLVATMMVGIRVQAQMLSASEPITQAEVGRAVFQTLYQCLVENRPVLLRNILADSVRINGVQYGRFAASEALHSSMIEIEEDLYSGDPNLPLLVELPVLGALPVTWARREDAAVPNSAKAGQAVISSTAGRGPGPFRDSVTVIKLDVELSNAKTGCLSQPRVMAVNVAANVLSREEIVAPVLTSSLSEFKSYDGNTDLSGSRSLLNSEGPVRGIGGVSFVHRPVYPFAPDYTPRLTRNVCQDYLEVDLFSPLSSIGANTQTHTGFGYLYREACFVVDETWNRIIYGEIEGSNTWLKAYGPDRPVSEHEIPGATGIAADNGEGGESEFAHVYVAEGWRGKGRLSRLAYSFDDQTLSYDDSLTLDSDELHDLVDVTINNAGTLDLSSDDIIWSCGGEDQAEVLKFNSQGPPGVQLRYGGRNEMDPSNSPLYKAIGIVSGRDFSGNHNDLLYVLDERPPPAISEVSYRLVCLRDIGNSLTEETDYFFPNNYMATGITADRWGSIYVIGSTTDAQYDQSWIMKFLPDLRLIDVDLPQSDGDDGIHRPRDISNPLSVQDPIDSSGVISYGDLLISEWWDDNSGGQWYLIGTEITSLAAQEFEVSGPDSMVQVSHSATDGCITQLSIDYWSTGLNQWVFLQGYGTVTVGPGLSSTIVKLVDHGAACGYRFVLYYESRYHNWLGDPVNSGYVTTVLNTCNCSCAMNGDCNLDGLIDVQDVLWLMDFVIAAGPPPSAVQDCPQEGDWNCDGRIDVADVTATVDYAFRRGAGPCNQCSCSNYPAGCPPWPETN